MEMRPLDAVIRRRPSGGREKTCPSWHTLRDVHPLAVATRGPNILKEPTGIPRTHEHDRTATIEGNALTLGEETDFAVGVAG